MAAVIDPLQDHFEALAGPAFIGLFVNLTVAGMMVVQAWDYFILYYAADKEWIKASVAIISALVMISSGTATSLIWFQYVEHFGEVSHFFNVLPAQYYVYPILAPFVSAFVQSFFAWRTWGVGESIPIAAVTSLFTVVSFASGLAVPLINATHSHVSAVVFERVYFWSSAAANLVITISFIMTLKKRVAHSRTTSDQHAFYRGFDTLLQAASLTTVISLAGAIASSLPGDKKSVGDVFMSMLIPAYASAYFHALNSRKELRLVLEGSESGGTGNAASFFTKSNVPGGRAHEQINTTGGVTVHLETFRIDEDGTDELAKGRINKVAFSDV